MSDAPGLLLVSDRIAHSLDRQSRSVTIVGRGHRARAPNCSHGRADWRAEDHVRVRLHCRLGPQGESAMSAAEASAMSAAEAAMPVAMPRVTTVTVAVGDIRS